MENTGSGFGEFVIHALFGEPTPNHLDDWGLWAWAGSIVFLGALFLGATFTSVLLGLEPNGYTAAAAIVVNFAYGMLLASVMRHTPQQWIVWMTALILFAGTIALIRRWGVTATEATGWFWSYLMAIAAHLGPGLYDRAARLLNMTPANWSTVGLVLIIACVFAIGMWSRSRTS